MENMKKGLIVPKWVLLVQPKIPQSLSAQFACLPKPKIWDFSEKRLHWASLVRELFQSIAILKPNYRC